MRRKLALLNLVLLVLLAGLVQRYREQTAAAREREARMLGVKIVPRKYPRLAPLPPVTPAVGATYIDVAKRMLLAKDRNSDVIIDPEPVKVKPKMPALPSVQGLMTLGEPGIIMTERTGVPQRTYHPGDTVGPFTLVAFDSEKVVFDWDGEKVEKKLDDLMEKGTAPGAGPEASAAPAAGAAKAAPTQQTGPGGDIGGGQRACRNDDATPAGTVLNGLKKVEVNTPFGRSCRWEPAK